MSTLTSAAYSSNFTPAPGTTNQFRNAATALLSMRGFLANRQFVGLFVAASPFTGDTPDFFQTRVLDLQQRINALQDSAGVDDDGDATVHLNYFTSCTHWYITKRDIGVGDRRPRAQHLPFRKLCSCESPGLTERIRHAQE